MDAGSAGFLAFIGNDPLHPDFGGDAAPPPSTEIYGMVYVSVPGSQALEQVAFLEYAGERDPGAPGRPVGYPIPVEARTQPKWIEGGAPGGGTRGDRHLLIVDRDNLLLFELYHAQWNPGLSRWEAGSGAAWSLLANARRPEGWTSADAAGLAILPGLVRYDEVYGPNPISHAFRFTVHATDGHVFPASHTAGSTAGAPPMGTRLRLKAAVDISGFPAPIGKIFQLVGLRDFEHLKPSQLSGGMQKRVALARALALDPEIVFYDEPTSGLDPVVSGVIDQLILILSQRMNITSVVVTHDTRRAFKIADKMVVLFRGKVVAVFFGFTHCPDVCPTALAELAAVARELGPDADKLQVLFITVDPDRDTSALLAQYVPSFNPAFLGLRGDAEALARTAKDFKVYYSRRRCRAAATRWITPPASTSTTGREGCACSPRTTAPRARSRRTSAR